jgi:iron complex transport system substrate-binding protein
MSMSTGLHNHIKPNNRLGSLFLVLFEKRFTLPGFLFAGLLIWAVLPAKGIAAVAAIDDGGERIVLDAPAKRIVSLAPHITELLYEIGAGESIVATVDFSDYPPQAKKIPSIGRHNALDLERIVALQPDLVIAWQSGNPRHQVDTLRQLNLPVFFSEPRKLEDVAHTLERFGILTGHAAAGVSAKQAFNERYEKLKARYFSKRTVTVFYEIWNQPLTTINGEHIINEVIELCGGENVFKSLPVLAPIVSIEAVLKADPQVIIASGVDGGAPPWLDHWQKWQGLRAVKQQHIYFINPDIIHRHTVRLLEGARQVCTLLERARAS